MSNPIAPDSPEGRLSTRLVLMNMSPATPQGQHTTSYGVDTTPEDARAVERLFNAGLVSPTSPLSPITAKKMKSSMSRLERLRPSPRRAQTARRVHGAFAGAVRTTPRKERAKWTHEFQRRTKGLMSRVGHTGVYLDPLDIEHEHTLERHVDSPAPRDLIAPGTGIYQADGKTCFPDRITTIVDLTQFYDSSVQIAPERGSFTLHQNGDIYFLAAMENANATIATYFPVFHYAKFSTGRIHEITDSLSFLSEKLLHIAKNALETFDGQKINLEPLRFIIGRDHERRVVINIAPFLPLLDFGKLNIFFEASVSEIGPLHCAYKKYSALFRG